MGGPVFFFSYARDDERGDRGALATFYEDLETAVRVHGGFAGEIGFRDVSDISLGSRWASAVTAALLGSRSMVCLYSPTYFQRPYCGKEFAFFQRRLMIEDVQREMSESRTLEGLFNSVDTAIENPAPLMLPVLWVPLPRQQQLPIGIDLVQFYHRLLPREVLDVGMRRLTQDAGPKYRDAIDFFAKTIVDRVLESNPQPFDPDKLGALESMPDVFTPAGLDANRAWLKALAQPTRSSKSSQ